MKVAITGATGFVGRHVLAELTQRRTEVTAIVRPASRGSPCLQGVSVLECDIHKPPEDLFYQLGEPDVLMHLAWGGLPNYKSQEHIDKELPAQYHFIEKLVHSGLSRVLVTGTCFEYGMQSGPLSASAETKPANPYGFAKDSLRRQLLRLRQEHAFELIWARLFYLYGEGQAEASLLPQLQRAVERRDKVFNLSGGEQLRDYLDVKVAAQQLVALCAGKGSGATVNICSGSPISVRQLVENWVRDHGVSIDLNFGHYPYPDYEPMAFWGLPVPALHMREPGTEKEP